MYNEKDELIINMIAPYAFKKGLIRDERRMRAEFEGRKYMRKFIINKIGKPPAGSLFKSKETEWDSSGDEIITYFELIYIYSEKNKLHVIYKNKVEELINSSHIEREYSRNFEKAFKNYYEE